MSIDLLERAAAALGPLLGDVVFVGGATVTLWITDPAAPPPRPTKDVDVVVQVHTRAQWHDFEARLRTRGFAEDTSSRVICRWRFDDQHDEDLILDAMPADAALMGLANRWQRAALPHAVERRLPSGALIRAVAPAYLIATKLEAFAGRGNGDHLASQDLEDIVQLVDGRPELVHEVGVAPAEVRAYIAAEFCVLLGESRYLDAIQGFLRPDTASQARAQTMVLPRLHAIADGADEDASFRPK